MRYVQLRAFHHVATCGGFSRAADMLRLTQPAVSDQVRKLEEEYDVLLFNRVRKQITLTPDGEKLLVITRRLFDSEREAYELLSDRLAFQTGNLRITADSAHHLLQILTRFREKHPGVKVALQTGNTDTVIRSLKNYEAEIGVVGDVLESPEFELVPLGRSPIIAFVARTHPAATINALHLSDLPGLPLVFREEGSRTRLKLQQAAEAAGINLVPVIVAEGREAVREIVAAGAGIGFVSAAEYGQDARLHRMDILDAPEMMMDESLICLSERKDGKLVRAFFNLARTLP